MGHLAGGVHPGVGSPRHGEGDREAQQRARACSSTPWTVRRPGWPAHPERSVPP